ncbi:unnamed protein product [marine sediment metagenome]|uniref:Uncharacterized protein n=1 Tax=marine sediment metagenome TaxID=412755 RepID=X0UZ57_9ZZZZ
MISVSQAQTLSSKQNLKVCVLIIAVLMLVLNGLVPAKDNGVLPKNCTSVN